MKVTILDPALCCNTGVCGPDVDNALVHTASNVKWLKAIGFEVHRHNISNDVSSFKEYPVALEKLQKEGIDSLPYILVNDAIVQNGAYPSKEEWQDLIIANPPGVIPQTTEQSAKNTMILMGIGAAIAVSNETSLKEFVAKAKTQGIAIEEFAIAMTIGNDARNSLSQNVIHQDNHLLKELHSTGVTWDSNSGCC